MLPSCAAPVEEYMADVITESLKHGDQAGGLKAHGMQLADRSPPESVAGLSAAIQIAVCQSGRPGEAVVEADLVPEGAATVDVSTTSANLPAGNWCPSSSASSRDKAS